VKIFLFAWIAVGVAISIFVVLRGAMYEDEWGSLHFHPEWEFADFRFTMGLITLAITCFIPTVIMIFRFFRKSRSEVDPEVFK